MPRVKGGTVARKRRKKILKLAKGYYGSKHTLYRTANEQVMHSLSYAYRDRKNKKRNFRKLWITRINAGCRINGMSYSKFMHGLNVAGIEINRKMLSELAIHDEKGFAGLVEKAKEAIASGAAKKERTMNVKDSKVAAAPVAKEAQVEVNADDVNLDSLKVAELKDIAKERGISVTGLKKAEIIEALS
jgi:large subunit ribosomal protein L20